MHDELMKKFFLAAMVVATTLLPLSAARAYSKSVYHWPYANPTIVYVNMNSSIPWAWGLPFASAMSAWNQAGARFRFAVGAAGHDVSLKYLWFENAVAVTRIRETNGQTVTTDRDTDFNSKYSWDVNGASNKLDAWSVMTHEFGHWTTLYDEYNWWESANTMYYGTDYGQTFQRTLMGDDMAGVRAIYGNL